MNSDNFTRHIGAATVALIAVLTTLGILWQVTHGHDVDPLLAGLATLTIGLLLPSPVAPAQRVTVANEADDPVPVEAAPEPPKRQRIN